MNVVDAHVGSRVRRTRLMRDVALSELAAALGAPVWQVELFERGAARMPAHMLLACGRLLKVRPSFFLEGEIEISRAARKPERAIALAGGRDVETVSVFLIVSQAAPVVRSRAS